MLEFWTGAHASLVTTTNDVIKLFKDRQQNFTKTDFTVKDTSFLSDNHI
jgi:hypothetical protein